jgi:hypothetical protein
MSAAQDDDIVYDVFLRPEFLPSKFRRGVAGEGVHYCGCDLAHIVAQVNFVAGGIVRKLLIKEMQGFDATGKRLQVDFFAPSFVARFEADKRDDQLQIVFFTRCCSSRSRISLSRIWRAYSTRALGCSAGRCRETLLRLSVLPTQA